MDLDTNRRLAREWVRAFNEEDFDAFDDLLTPDYRYHVGEWCIDGIEAAKAHGRRIGEIWNPHRFEILDEIAEGDRVCLRLVARDHHVGTYAGIPPTGREVTFEATIVFAIRDGRLAEGWRTGNDLDRVEQLGGWVAFDRAGPDASD